MPSSRLPDPMDAPALRWGVLGTGWIAERFTGALRRSELAALTVAVDGAVWTIEQTPSGRGDPSLRGVVATGPVGVRVLGSAALAITQVALGNAVAAVLTRYHEWDVAGALCLATEAGALVLGRDGRSTPLPEGGLLVAAPQVAAEVGALWRG